MRDPVVLHTEAGRSYERSVLEDQLRRYPYLDPATGQRHSKVLRFTPNRVLKDLIDAWFQENDVSLPPQREHLTLPPPPRNVSEATRQLLGARPCESRVRQTAAKAIIVRCVLYAFSIVCRIFASSTRET